METVELAAEDLPGGSRRGCLSTDDEVDAVGNALDPTRGEGAQAPLDSVADHGIANGSRHNETDSRRSNRARVGD